MLDTRERVASSCTRCEDEGKFIKKVVEYLYLIVFI